MPTSASPAAPTRNNLAKIPPANPPRTARMDGGRADGHAVRLSICLSPATIDQERDQPPQNRAAADGRGISRSGLPCESARPRDRHKREGRPPAPKRPSARRRAFADFHFPLSMPLWKARETMVGGKSSHCRKEYGEVATRQTSEYLQLVANRVATSTRILSAGRIVALDKHTL